MAMSLLETRATGLLWYRSISVGARVGELENSAREFYLRSLSTASLSTK